MEYNGIEEDTFYVMTCKSIFENQQPVFYDTGRTLKKLIKDMKIWTGENGLLP